MVDILVKVALSLFIGGALGLDRESKRQPAGLRTYMLVCLGAASTMMTGLYIYNAYGIGDPARIGAQVVSGIGFLGAGTIIVTHKNRVKGLTTAAGLWAAACAGLAIGAGHYAQSVILAIAIIFIMSVLSRFDHYMETNSKQITVYVCFTNHLAFDNLIKQIKQNNWKIIDLRISKSSKGNDGIIATVSIWMNKKKSHTDIIDTFSNIEGLKSIEEI